MDLKPIFISDLLEDLGEDADGLFPVEPEGTVIGPADQVVWILGLYDAQWTSHAMRDARELPKCSDTSLLLQFTGKAFIDVLKDHDVKISMDGKGRATDNIMVERLWRSVKYEDVYLKDYETVENLITGLREYFEFYNNERPHQSFGVRTPAEVYHGISTIREAA